MQGEKEEVDDLPILQNHEQRITTLEVTMTGLSNKMDKVEDTIKDGNREQKEMLDKINNRMIEEFFTKKSLNLANGWKLLFALLGTGGIVYLLVDKFL